MYCDAMEEIGADSRKARQFSEAVSKYGFQPGIELLSVQEASKNFMLKTMGFIGTDKPHVVAAAFALGREKIIPDMFRALLKEMNIGKEDARAFHYYLERHIHLDEDFHAPLSLHMLNELCAGNEEKISEAETAAKEAIAARIAFWDGVEHYIKTTLAEKVA